MRKIAGANSRTHRQVSRGIESGEPFKPGPVQNLDHPARLRHPATALKFAQLARDDFPRGAQFGGHLLMGGLDLAGATRKKSFRVNWANFSAAAGCLRRAG